MAYELKSILFVNPSGKPGGAERALVSLAQHLPSLGFNPVVALLEEGPACAWFEHANCRVVRFPAGRVRQVRRTARTIASLAALAESTSARIVMSNQSKGHIYGGLAALAAQVPAVWWQHGIPKGGVIERLAARIPTSAVVCSSDASCDAQSQMNRRLLVEKVNPGIPLKKIATYRGRGSQIRARLGWERRRVVGIVARLQTGKGQDVFLRGAAKLMEEYPDVQFAVVGGAVLGWEGSYQDDLHELARTLGLSNRVYFAGHQEDAYPWLDALDIVVHASSGEAFGLVLVEAMALGKPIVATALGGPAEIIEDRRTGLLVRSADPTEIAQAVRALLDDPELAATLGTNAARRSTFFSEERMAHGVARILHGVGAEPHSKRAGFLTQRLRVER